MEKISSKIMRLIFNKQCIKVFYTKILEGGYVVIGWEETSGRELDR